MTKKEAIHTLMTLLPSKEKLVSSWTDEHRAALLMAIHALRDYSWHKVADGDLPKGRVFLAYNPVTKCYDTMKWNERNGGFDRMEDTTESSLKESHFEDYYDYWMDIPKIPKDD